MFVTVDLGIATVFTIAAVLAGMGLAAWGVRAAFLAVRRARRGGFLRSAGHRWAEFERDFHLCAGEEWRRAREAEHAIRRR